MRGIGGPEDIGWPPIKSLIKYKVSVFLQYQMANAHWRGKIIVAVKLFSAAEEVQNLFLVLVDIIGDY